jgi:chromate transporter
VAIITPGPAVITVAFIGYLVNGMWGACAAGIGVILPVYLFVVLLGPPIIIGISRLVGIVIHLR